jgi:hypothetical protein
LVCNRPSRFDGNYTEALIFQRFAHNPVALGLRRLLVLGSVNENADAGNAVPLEIEIGLNWDAVCRRMLRVAG